MADAFELSVYNVLLNRAGNANGGGVFPDLADAVALTPAKTWAGGYGAWAELAAAVAVTADVWITRLYAWNFAVTGGDEWQVQLGTGAGGAEAAITGSAVVIGDEQVSDVGHVPSQTVPYLPFIFVGSGTRIAARAANDQNAANTIAVKVGYRTGLGT